MICFCLLTWINSICLFLLQAFVDEKLWAILTQQLGQLLRKEFNERSEDDGLVIERILILVRNILQVPKDALGERRTDDEASIHDQVSKSLYKIRIKLKISRKQNFFSFCYFEINIFTPYLHSLESRDNSPTLVDVIF